MTDFLSRLREAIRQLELRGADVASQAANDGIGTDLTLTLDAARCFSEGEPLLWCTTHEAKASQVWDECHVASRLRGREEDCHIVSQWRCPPPEGES